MGDLYLWQVASAVAGVVIAAFYIALMIQRLEAENKALTDRLANELRNVSTAKNREQQAEGQVDGLKKRLIETQKNLAVARADIKELSTTITELTEQIDKLREQLNGNGVQWQERYEDLHKSISQFVKTHFGEL